MTTRRLSVGICGIRGIPACYGGFETFAEELAVRLAERGHSVRVYGRKHLITHDSSTYRGVHLELLPAPRHKYLETPVHSLLCFLHLLRSPVDALLVCNAANSPFMFLPRLRGIPVAINVDGIERLRAKWNFLGRAWYRLGERCSVWFSSRIVSDAEVIRRYYAEQYRAESTVIAYGYRETEPERVDAKSRGEAVDWGRRAILEELGLEQDRYLLYVSRLEPENNAHRVIEAYNALPEALRSMPLVIVGDAPYAREYIAGLHREAGPNVKFAGFRFGQSYVDLQQAAYLYIQATEVGGTHPALVEAMGFANAVIANDTPENREVLADCGVYYEKNSSQSLRAAFERLIAGSAELKELRRKARARAKELYNWEKITSDYEELFYALSSRS